MNDKKSLIFKGLGLLASIGIMALTFAKNMLDQKEQDEHTRELIREELALENGKQSDQDEESEEDNEDEDE